MVPLRSNTIQLVQNGCSFHGLWSEDPNQHLKDFLKLVDSLDLNSENRERTRLCLFQFSLRDQASNCLERLLAGSITTWEDLTTRFLAQFFLSGRTAKLRNDILMFQQHYGESLSEAWSYFKDLLQKFPYHGIDRWLQIQILYDHVSFHLKCEIDRAAGGKLRNKNTDESWEIIENLALYDHEGWDETKEFIKPVKAISTPQGVPKTPDRRLLELKDQTNFARGINIRMTEMFRLLKELTTSRTLEKVLVREEAKFPITKNVNFISLTKGEEERSNMTKVTPDNIEMPAATEAEMPVIEAEKKNGAKNGAKNKSIKTPENKEIVEAPDSITLDQELGLERKKGKEYKALPGGPVYDAILKKKITKKEDIGGNFEIPCSIGNLKHVNALVDQGSDVNVVPYSTYMKLTDERPAETEIRTLTTATHIKENEKRPFILGTPFLTTAKASIKFDKGTITLRSGKSKVDFHRIPDSLCSTDKGVKNDIEPITSTMTVNRLVLEWEEKIKLSLGNGDEVQNNGRIIKFSKQASHSFLATKAGMDR
ncbi:MAK10-like protein [Tanacetum coccineum]